MRVYVVLEKVPSLNLYIFSSVHSNKQKAEEVVYGLEKYTDNEYKIIVSQI